MVALTFSNRCNFGPKRDTTKSCYQIIRSRNDRSSDLFRGFLTYLFLFQKYGGFKKLERLILLRLLVHKTIPATISRRRSFIPAIHFGGMTFSFHVLWHSLYYFCTLKFKRAIECDRVLFPPKRRKKEYEKFSAVFSVAAFTVQTHVNQPNRKKRVRHQTLAATQFLVFFSSF